MVWFYRMFSDYSLPLFTSLKYFLNSFFYGVLFVFSWSSLLAENEVSDSGFVYYSESQLLHAKAEIAAGNAFFVERYEQLLSESDELLSTAVDSVVNKTMKTPSGDIHDYISIAPYRWPDDGTEDGLPWKAIDGVINPVTRGPDTDFARMSVMFDMVDKLSFAYFFSDDSTYSDKCLEVLNVWFVDPETKVNPNINYGQGVPGYAEGRPAGLIEWVRISNVVTAVQILSQNGVMSEEMLVEMNAWIGRYLDWVLTSRLGREANALPQNHANWYNYQAVGLLIYMGRVEEARLRVEDAKVSRIAAQIEPDGCQPLEVGRTKSMHYSCMNLWALTNLAYMGRSIGVDLWDFETDDGRSLRQAFRYLEPYVLRAEVWPYKEISKGGIEVAIRRELLPLFSKSSTLMETELISGDVDVHHYLSPLAGLRYPPAEISD